MVRSRPSCRGGSHLVGTRHQLSVASAQVKTAIALAAMQARGTTEVSEPIPSRDHTERMLAALGAPLSRIDRRTFRLRPGPLTAFELDVPGDPSSAAFWVVAALVTPGSDLVLEGVALNPTRLAFVDVLRRMGAAVQLVPTGEHLGEPVGNIHVVAGPLMATTVLGDEVPLLIDEIPVLAVAAAFAEGTTEFRDAAELRVKESDRIASLVDLLRTLGIAVQPSDDGLTVSGGRPRPGRLPVHGDHRIAMAAAVAANAADGASLVEDWPAVVSSYPEFADDLAALTGRGR